MRSTADEGAKIMVATLVNLKHESIDEEIDNILELYSDEFCQQLSTIPNFRQRLHNYVLDEMELEKAESSCNKYFRSKVKLPYRSLELRLQLERYINQGIAHILGIDSQALDRYIPRDDYVVFIPSH
ncbi:hypothetical protein HC931_17065 [Candidatus Gracilibacteria bacterium]|jgi:hypothetical protein|nr:hypothetical protein [Candidatus Gracilibacteria bacterium]NJM88092.1 hypothetical protein [Hydrococcus sp. RU_2_2]NJP20096.1 hypothetical protein [Hydrococcus sp. CRU_1_1]NJQ98561.1 hypothetical protein [Hydrococcus sp. CSU_1_8]